MPVMPMADRERSPPETPKVHKITTTEKQKTYTVQEKKKPKQAQGKACPTVKCNLSGQ